jgi:hypothetical protein
MNLTSIDETLKKMADLRKDLEAARKTLETEAKKAFHSGIKSVFEDFPEVVAIRWTQYTPYFNDGGTCEFGSNHQYAGILFNNHKYCGDDEFDDIDESSEYDREDCKKFDLAKDHIHKLLNNFTDEDMLSMFGDHAQITVTKDGVEIDGYEHD